MLPTFLASIGAPSSLIAASTTQPILNRRREQSTRHFRRLLRPLQMGRFLRSNQRVLNT